MKNLFKILILSLFTFSFCCGPEDVVKEEGNYKDGNKDGKWTSYCEHGNIIEEGNYRDGKKHGKWTSYFDDGQIWYVGNYKDGKKHGEFVYYGYGNYNILHKVRLQNFKDGKLNGKHIEYHINGEINSIVNYKDEKKVGKNNFYDKDGRMYWSGYYKDGILMDGDFIKSDKPFNLH